MILDSRCDGVFDKFTAPPVLYMQLTLTFAGSTQENNTKRQYLLNVWTTAAATAAGFWRSATPGAATSE